MRNSIVLVAALAIPGTSFAQTFGTGMGFPLGEKSRVHTNLDLGVGFDSNPRRFDSNPAIRSVEGAPADGKLSDWRTIIRPSLAVDVPGNSVKLGLDAGLSINHFFGVGTNPALTRFGGNVGAELQLGSDNSFLSFKLEDQLVRTAAFLDAPGTVGADEIRFPEWNNRGTARFTLRPGGRALEVDIGYMNELQIYDGTLPRSQRHGGLLEARWKFLPKTALVFHADVSTFNVWNDENTAFQSSDALPLLITLGLVGQVTTKLTGELTLGYEDTLSERSFASSRTVVGNAVVTYQFNDTTSFSVGYRRRARPIVVMNSFFSDAPFAQFKVNVGGRLVISGLGQYEFRNYAPVVDGGDRLAVGVAIADARVEYWFFQWLSAAVAYRALFQNPSDEAKAVLGDPNFAPYLQDFSRHQALLMVGLRY